MIVIDSTDGFSFDAPRVVWANAQGRESDRRQGKGWTPYAVFEDGEGLRRRVALIRIRADANGNLATAQRAERALALSPR